MPDTLPVKFPEKPLVAVATPVTTTPEALVSNAEALTSPVRLPVTLPVTLPDTLPVTLPVKGPLKLDEVVTPVTTTPDAFVSNAAALTSPVKLPVGLAKRIPGTVKF